MSIVTLFINSKKELEINTYINGYLPINMYHCIFIIYEIHIVTLIRQAFLYMKWKKFQNCMELYNSIAIENHIHVYFCKSIDNV